MPPPVRRPRPSLVPNTGVGLEDISTLTLAEVRSRIERNERVLNTILFSSSPTGSPNLATSPTPASPLRPQAQPQSPTPDPFREKLLDMRQQLLAREKELLQELENDMDKMDVSDPSDPSSPIAESSSGARRRSSGAGGVGGTPNLRSGKARALETIKAGESALHPNGIILPYATTIALSDRDFDNATAQSFSEMALSSSASAPDTPTRSKPKFNPHDEIARAQAEARMKAFMSYKGDPDEEDDDGFLDDDDDGVMDGEGDYDGDGDRFELEAQGREPHRREKGTGEEVDEVGEDDEDWAEGNEEYLDRIR